MPGLFSISDSEKVFFSKGNLTDNTGALEFEDNQYDYGSFFHPKTDSQLINNYISSNGWRMLTGGEWNYIFKNRNSSSYCITINGTTGKLLLPDGWITPDGITLPTSDKEEISPETWALLESNGAVFLPYVGHSKYYEYQTNLYRHSITQVNVSGSYYINNNNYRVHDTMGIWTSAYIYNITAEAANWIEVDQRAVGSKGIKSYLGAVRLVQDYVKE